MTDGVERNGDHCHKLQPEPKAVIRLKIRAGQENALLNQRREQTALHHYHSLPRNIRPYTIRTVLSTREQ